MAGSNCSNLSLQAANELVKCTMFHAGDWLQSW